MKAGILTFHFSDNLGAALQAYALQTVVKQLGHDCEIIDYRPAGMPDDNRHLISLNFSSPYTLIRSLLGGMIHFPSNMVYQYRWKKFRRDHFCLSEKVNGKAELINTMGYDILIVGSDQVWNEQITGPDSGYFLEWAAEEIKKISYAASFGEKTNAALTETEYVRKLERFHFLSVREVYARDILSLKIKNEIQVLPDPTLLLQKKDMKLRKQSLMKRPYLFLYIVTVTPLVKQAAYMIARKRGLTVVDIGDQIYPFCKRKKHIHDAGPWEFVNLVYYADVVVTSSFHGTVFSMLFHKEFYSVPGSVQDGRISDLCRKLGTESNVIYKMSDLKRAKTEIDYELLEKKLEEIRNQAENWLRETMLKNERRS